MDHPEISVDVIPEDERDSVYIPDRITLHRTERGWVDILAPKDVHTERTLPPLPWQRLP